jgi:hypothetical protein
MTDEPTASSAPAAQLTTSTMSLAAFRSVGGSSAVMDIEDVHIGTVTRVAADPVQTVKSVTGTPLIELVQQSTGTTCQTSQGVCTVAPKPISSSCACGRYSGKVTG